MAINNSVKIKTGIFVTGGITLLLLIIFFIGNQRNLFQTPLPYMPIIPTYGLQRAIL